MRQATAVMEGSHDHKRGDAAEALPNSRVRPRKDLIESFVDIPIFAFCFRGLLYIIGASPMAWSRAWGILTFVSVGMLTGRIATAMTNLQRVFPDLGRRQRRWIAWQCLLNFAQSSMEFFSVATARDRKLKSMTRITEGEAFLNEARDSGRPLIFVLAHSGPFGAVGRLMQVLLEQPVGTFVHGSEHGMFDQIKSLYGACSGPCAMTGYPLQVRRLLRQVKRGLPLVMMIDGRRPDGVPVLWMGHPTLMSLGYARLALRYDALVVPMRVVRSQRPYRFELSFASAIDCRAVQDELFPSQEQQPHEPQQVESVMADRVHAVLEKWILADPPSWFWFHRCWL